jgi:xanthine dehydrogenase molybdopterin-binding subunit B
VERRKIYEETLQCGYKRCCPTVHVFDDGSIELSDDDTESGSVGTIKMRPEVADRFLKLMLEHKK